MVSSADPAVSRRDFATGETGRGPFIPTNRASNPRAGQWTNAMSHNMIADYKRFLMTDGEGIRCSLYVSGCHSTARLLQLVDLGFPRRPRIQRPARSSDHGRSEPAVRAGHHLPRGRAAAQHRRAAAAFTQDPGAVRPHQGHLVLDGLHVEELMREGESPDKRELLEQIDILVDGRYIKDLHDSLLQFRGSSNQRIIDVPKSLESGQVVLWSKLHDQTRFIPEIYGKDALRGRGRLPEWFRTVRVRTVGIRQADYIRCLIMRRVVRFMRYRAELGRGTDYHYILG